MAALAQSSARCLSSSSARGSRALAARPLGHRSQRSVCVVPKAVLGGGDENKEDKKKITREEEPEEYWSSAGERKGANPLKDPLAIIGLAAIFLPFGLLLLAGATGVIDFSVYR